MLLILEMHSISKEVDNAVFLSLNFTALQVVYSHELNRFFKESNQ
jgi:hypothetical protein